ncbi:MAG TPA: response regulator transcription factor [Anaerolineaceae bacterium]|nr:response regulator transcription factor [Anaerolineaceae bacterium]
MAPVRVVLVDDHPIVRAGIKNLLNQSEEIQIVGETGSGTEVLRLVEATNPDVLLLDMELPGLAGVDIARRLHASKSSVRVLALSAFDDKQYILRILEQGAAGYLTKDEAPEMIVDAVLGVARGEQGWLSRKVAARVADWMKEEDGNSRRLTPREIEVLRLLTDGKTNQGIGSELGISEKTVEKYLDSMFKKLGVSSRVDAAVRAIRDRLV